MLMEHDKYRKKLVYVSVDGDQRAVSSGLGEVNRALHGDRSTLGSRDSDRV